MPSQDQDQIKAAVSGTDTQNQQFQGNENPVNQQEQNTQNQTPMLQPPFSDQTQGLSEQTQNMQGQNKNTPLSDLPNQGAQQGPEDNNTGPSVAGMQPSLRDAQQNTEEDEGTLQLPMREQESPEQDVYTPQQDQSYQPQEQYYDPYAAQPQSADAISEVAEQIVAEKLAPIRRAVEDTLDHRSTIEAKLTHLNDRLRRIENIIDELQLSILQKVGQYVTDVSDLKKEVIETQKSFKTLHGKSK